MAPLFGTRTKSTTVIRLRGFSVELQGSSKVGIQDTLVFPICRMCWGGCLFLKGDRRLDLFCFTKLLTVWHKCTSKPEGVLVEAYKGTRRKHNIKFRQISHTTSMYGQLFFLKLLVHGTGLLSWKLCHWLYLDQVFLTISVQPFRIIVIP